MSIQFNDTTNYKGLVQFYEKEVGYNRGDVSGNDDLKKEFAAEANLAFDDFLSVAFGPDGTWQFDDSNQTDYPFITTNIVSGQRDYTFTTDGSSNLILDIYRVMAKPSATGYYQEISPVDQNTPNNQNLDDTTAFIDGRNTAGIPTRYDKIANGIMLDPIPNYNASLGLKIFINREPSYFAYSDTTKKPGVPGTLHAWFYLKPAYNYAKRHSLASLPRIERDVELMKKTIESTFAGRERDKSKGFQPFYQNNK
jgi:hypothetical protein